MLPCLSALNRRITIFRGYAMFRLHCRVIIRISLRCICSVAYKRHRRIHCLESEAYMSYMCTIKFFLILIIIRKIMYRGDISLNSPLRSCPLEAIASSTVAPIRGIPPNQSYLAIWCILTGGSSVIHSPFCYYSKAYANLSVYSF